MDNQQWRDGLTLTMQRGPFQNNGAAPWYTLVPVGTPGQLLKLSLDSGTNITWITSTLCSPDRCQHYSAGRFDYQASSSFTFTDCLQRPYSFGPWGTMQVKSGSDVLTLNNTVLPTQLLLAADYTGTQFHQLDWDGGMGLPSSSAYVDGRSSFVFQTLMNSGKIAPHQPFVAFDWDPASRRGVCQMGAVEAEKTRGPHLFLPWSLYSKVRGVEYIWSTPLVSYTVGGDVLARNVTFALDSGSSRFKGDDRLMRQTLERIAQGGSPEVVLGFADGEITLGPDLYNVLIEEGPDQGKTLPQFEPLGLADLVLVGSLVMEHCYTVYEYRVVQCRPGAYSLAPVGMWLFNRPQGPQIITRSSSRRFEAEARTLVRGNQVLSPTVANVQTEPPFSVAGTWKNDYGSVMTLTVTGNVITGSYQSSTGSTGQYAITGYQASTSLSQEQGLPVALAIDWHPLDQQQADPSWHWVSGLCGQLHQIAGEDRFELSHLLVATREFPDLANQGTYLDKLSYRRVPGEAIELNPVAPTMSSKQDNPLNGTWLATEGYDLKLHVSASSQLALGCVSGTLTTSSECVEISGFTDINAGAVGLSLQSVSLTAAQKSGDTVLTLAGSLDLKEDGLTLLALFTSSTPASRRYVQTQVKSILFKRALSAGANSI
ncbi:avidin/streptavidin family protein [Pseudomonas reactans]|uniref:avidin/streptavidin family protein n=1 Tax=Pseudomonas reactans TaxID=117680 RepID=UPI0015A2CD92|nr:avidin/streptavidin family protein [Pseudomonas reactans]NWA65368.1 peptidase A1 pepsin [Pseudomonas reactans]